MIDEATLKKELVDALEAALRGVVVFRHEDIFTSGIPDFSVAWEGPTTWLEVKKVDRNNQFTGKRVGGKSAKGKSIQALTCARLARTTARCWYVLYKEDGENRATMIVHPYVVLEMKQKRRTSLPDEWTVGFRHDLVVNRIRETHT